MKGSQMGAIFMPEWEENVSIEFSQFLTTISVCAAVYFAARGDSRASNDEVSKKAEENAIALQKLDSISADTQEIRKEISDVKVKVNDLSERVVIVEQSTKSAHHRLDRYEDEDYPRRERKRRRW